ncbi:MAG: hypothetical protein J3K34DRAFT_426533, partial [Monoraphidium minutum]
MLPRSKRPRAAAAAAAPAGAAPRPRARARGHHARGPHTPTAAAAAATASIWRCAIRRRSSIPCSTCSWSISSCSRATRSASRARSPGASPTNVAEGVPWSRQLPPVEQGLPAGGAAGGAHHGSPAAHGARGCGGAQGASSATAHPLSHSSSLHCPGAGRMAPRGCAPR